MFALVSHVELLRSLPLQVETCVDGLHDHVIQGVFSFRVPILDRCELELCTFLRVVEDVISVRLHHMFLALRTVSTSESVNGVIRICLDVQGNTRSDFFDIHVLAMESTHTREVSPKVFVDVILNVFFTDAEFETAGPTAFHESLE